MNFAAHYCELENCWLKLTMDKTPTKILIIGDNPLDARLVRQLLLDVGESRFEPVDVGRLADGIRQLKDNGCDTVLLDLSVADGAGIDLVARLQSAVAQAPIVVLPALDDRRLALDGMRAGAQEFLIKASFAGPLLARALRYAIDVKNERAPGVGSRFEVALPNYDEGKSVSVMAEH